jgi:hypothetical protein
MTLVKTAFPSALCVVMNRATGGSLSNIEPDIVLDLISDNTEVQNEQCIFRPCLIFSQHTNWQYTGKACCCSETPPEPCGLPTINACNPRFHRQVLKYVRQCLLEQYTYASQAMLQGRSIS